ncbi:MAG: PrsW family intramembrane metalloprotease [Patescibacteria group bacterium]
MFAFLIIGLSVLPNFIWLLFYLKQDPHPEPRPLLLLAFFLGIFSTVFALGAGVLLLRLFEFSGMEKQAVQNSFWFMFLGVALVEELFKFLMAYLFLRRNPVFDEPVDAVIYLVVIALGFAFVENIIYLVSVFNQYSGSFSQVVYFLTLRFVGANFLHSLASGLVGYFWAIGIIKHRPKKFIFLGIGLASLIHALFNFLVIKFGMPFYAGAVFLLFILALFLLRDAETLRQLGRPATLVVYSPDYLAKESRSRDQDQNQNKNETML